MKNTAVVCRTVSGIRYKIEQFKSEGKTIGFVPTMGALHEGHASLLKKARRECDIVVASIYANPTQFDNKEDLKNYPRTEADDLEICNACETDLVFIPITEDIYYSVLLKKVDYGTLTNTLEGAHRPGHFDGMTTIVRRLLKVVSPTKAFFGQKDFQQLAIIRHMNSTENLGAEIVGCEIIREEEGLALSSRNIRLSTEEKAKAQLLSKIVFQAPELKQRNSPAEIENSALDRLQTIGFKPDYVKIVDKDTFEEVKTFENNKEYRVLLAVYVGKVRLIDNGPV